MTAKKLYASVTGTTNIISVAITESHDNSTTMAVIEAYTTDLALGDQVHVDIGYTDDHAEVFYGYVKQIDKKIPENTYSITCSDVMIRAMDYFIAASNPEQPLKFSNIKAEELVRQLMAQAGLTNYTTDNTDTYFTFGVQNEFEINLVPTFEYCRAIADNLTWSLWADKDGVVHFSNRKPYVMVNEYPENAQPGWHADTAIVGYSINDLITLDLNDTLSEKNLRNRVVVYGNAGISGEASREVTVLPSGFYKTSVLGAPGLIDTQELAQRVAEYNLDLFCRFTEECRISVVGNPNIHARSVVTLGSTLAGLSGDWYIDMCEHQLSSSGYITALGLRRMIKQ